MSCTCTDNYQCPDCTNGKVNWIENHILDGERCREMREEMGWTMFDLARRCQNQDVSSATIAAFERGARDCPAGLVDELYSYYARKEGVR